MGQRSFKNHRLIPAAFVVLSAAVFGIASLSAAQSKINERKPTNTPAQTVAPTPTENAKPANTARYSYEFKQPEFVIRRVVISHDASGRGKITFEQKIDEQVIEEPIEMSQATLNRIMAGWSALNFLESTEEYQSERHYAHMGTMKLGMEQGTRKRTVEFDWTNNKDASTLANEYRRVADQAVLVFEISVARESQPLNTPKLMDEFELRLRINGLADPEQLLPLLKDISTDGHLPLIARNHALRLIKKIESK